MALRGVRVIEMAGLAPVPFCGMLLSDFGATVTRIDRTANNNTDVLHHGKRKLALNLKTLRGKEIIREMCKISDVIIDPFRPGVLEKLGLGPDVLLKDNSRLIYARLTGFGQRGLLSSAAGHDINYVAMSGLLSLLGRSNEKPTPPINFIADFAGGGLLCAFGICAALLERERSGLGQIVDNSMVEGSAYVGSWMFRSQDKFWFGNERGKNALDTGAHFYDTYKTKDGKYMAVGSVEPEFYKIVLDKLNLNDDEVLQFTDYEKNKIIFQSKFLEKTQAEWCEVFDGTDACVTPVLDWDTASQHPHNISRNVFVDRTQTNEVVPNPAPRLSRTPATAGVLKKESDEYQNAVEILAEIGLKKDDIHKLYEDSVLLLDSRPKL